MKSQDSKPFYEKGLQFECTRCRKCCTGFPGYVYLSETDIKNISEFLQTDKEGFIKRYTRIVHVFHEERLSLIEKVDYTCIFWDKICTIYPTRPHQCRTYPFWKRYLVSAREWNKAHEFCPGINRGRLHTKSEIEHFAGDIPNYDISKFLHTYPREPE